MNSPLVLEQYAIWRQEVYLREAAAERLALQARQPALSARARLSMWMYALARRLASDAQPAVHSWNLPDCCARPNEVEYWPSA